MQPTTDIATPAGAFESDCGSLTQTGTNCFAPKLASANPGKDPVPDLAFVLNVPQPWGHVQFHGVFRDHEMKDTAFIDRSYISYGGGFSGRVHPFMGSGGLLAKDSFGFQTYGCEGCGHWANWTGGSNGTTQGLATKAL